MVDYREHAPSVSREAEPLPQSRNGTGLGTGQESIEDKLRREARLVGIGLSAPLRDIQESPIGESALKYGTMIGLGVGLGLLSRYPGSKLLGVGARQLSTAFGIASLPYVGLSTYDTATALKDNWDSDKNWETNVAKVERSLGSLTTMLAVGGASIAGTRLLYTPTSALKSMSQDTMVRVHGREPMTIGKADMPISEGSGTIVSADGRVLTAFHVVGEHFGSMPLSQYPLYSKLSMTLPSGKTIPARVVGVSPELDLALIKPAQPLGYSLPFRNPASDFHLGTKVATTGFPHGEPLRSFPGKIIEGDPYLVQTTAFSKPGMSGGAISDTKGRIHSVVSGGSDAANGQVTTFGPSLQAIHRLLNATAKLDDTAEVLVVPPP